MDFDRMIVILTVVVYRVRRSCRNVCRLARMFGLLVRVVPTC